MAKEYKQIDSKLAAWIRRQHVFFVATAPSGSGGRVNCSPKGGDTFRIVDPGTVVYQDLTGSGAETIAHLRENGRIVIMFCAFEGPTKIVRLHGRGAVIRPGHRGYRSLSSKFPPNPGARALIRIKVTRVSDSCGYAVPFMDYRGPRKTLDQWAGNKGPEELERYRKDKNRKSIDGLPALD
jgi:Pyridoxamine 5'-phosphate oxidase